MPNPYYYNPDGSLNLWAGTGYDLLPRIAATDVGRMQAPYNSTGSDPVENTNPWFYGILDPGKYGLPTDSYNNFKSEGGDQSALNYLYKSGDKEGTKIRYTLEGDQYVPQVVGTQGWDTNLGAMQHIAPLAIMAGGLGAWASGLGAGAAAAGGAAGSAAGAGGSLLSELTAGGLAGGAAGGGAFGSMTAGGTLGGLTGGAGSLVPASLAGSLGPEFAAGLGGLGSLTPSASTLAAWDAAGVGGASGGSSLLDKIPKALQNPSTLSSLAKVGGMLAGGALGANGVEQSGQAATPQPVPTMYGSGAVGGSTGASWGPMGPTETERRMRREYLPGLLGGANPWGY